MAVETTMNSKHISAADAKKNAQNSKSAGATGYTDRGTAIVESNSTFNQNSFMNILVAELSNLDPTQNQDSTAYITQMAEFASIEQLNNLNTTMKDFAYEQMVGQVGILSEKDSDGYNKWGLITQVTKSGNATYATLQDTKTGKFETYDIKKIIGTSDSGYTTANFETALNANFLSASTLASSNAKAVVVDTVITNTDSEDGSTTTTTTTTEAHKGIIKSAYIDKQNSVVKVTVALLDDEGKESTKVYNYSDIAIAGELSDEVMDETIKNLTATNTSSKAKNISETVADTASKALISENKILSKIAGK